MTFKEYQKFVASKTAAGFPEREHAVLGLAGELGEICDAIKRADVYGVESTNDDVYEELGDLLFYVGMMANAYGIDLEHCLLSNVEKLNRRYKQGFTRTEAIERRDKR